MADIQAEKFTGQNPQQAKDECWNQSVSQLYFYIQKQLDGAQIKSNQYDYRENIDPVGSKRGHCHLRNLIKIWRIVDGV